MKGAQVCVFRWIDSQEVGCRLWSLEETKGKQAADVMGEQKMLLYVVSSMPRTLYRRERAPVSIVQEAGWSAGPVMTGVGNRTFLALTRVQNPNRLARI
jgi:hypothetical protein